jgi:hypothetical protein
MAKVWDKPITAETDWGGDASTGGLPVSGRMVQAYIKERLALASSKEDIEQFVKDYLEEIGMASDGGFVTLASEQIVKAIKDFAEGIKLNGSPLITYDAEKNAYVFPANVIAEGGIAAFSSLEEYDIPTIMDAVVTDEVTISKIGGVLQVLKAGLDKEELMAILEAEKYVDETWVKNFCVKYALAEDVVDLKSRQNITGIKNFVNGLEVGGKILKYDATKNAFILRANIIAEGGITAWGSLEGYDIPTIMDAINVDGQTIIKEDGMLKLNPNIDLGGGLDESQLEEYLATKQYAKKGDIATALIGYATQSWVTGRGYITSAALEPYAMKSTTLAGYGITDAYTKTQIDTSVNAINKSITDLRTYTDKTFVKLAVAQDITARHNFTNGLKIGGLSAYKSQEDVVFIDANVVVRGGITAWGDNEQTAPTIWDGFPCDNATIKRGADGLFYAEVQSGGGIDESQLETYLTTNKYAKKDDISSALNGYATQSWVTGRGYITSNALEPYALKTAIPTKLSQLTDDVVSGKYLSIAGGTVNGAVTINHSGATPLVINQNYGTASNPRGVVVMNSMLSNSNLYISHLFGKEGSMRNSAWVGFYLDSAGSNNNRLSMGLYGVDNVLNILGSGNVAIGGTTATEKLYVYGNLGLEGCLKVVKSTYPDIRGNGSYLTLSPDDVAGSKGSVGLYKTGDSSYEFRRVWDHYSYGSMNLGSSSNRWTTVYGVDGNFSGNVGIGGTTATEKFHLYGNMLFDGERVLKSSLIGEVLYMGGSYLVIGGGTTTKGIPTYIDGKTVYVRAGNYVATFSDAGGLTWNGNLLTNGAITMYYSSDERLKKNIRKVNASEVLMSLGGVWQYEYIDSEIEQNSTYGGSHYGLIYQNVKGTALDKMCFEREDGMGALNYLDTNFISLIAGATMENISEVEKLKRKIRTLENKVKQLEGRA